MFNNLEESMYEFEMVVIHLLSQLSRTICELEHII